MKTRISACPVCGGEELSHLKNNLTRCRCTHIFQSDLAVSCRYGADYLQTFRKLAEKDGMSALRGNFVARHLDLPKGGRVLDVGYGAGVFLKLMRKAGFDIYGIEVHGQDLGISEVSFDAGVSYDLVTFFDSLEHFDNLAIPLKLRAAHAAVTIPCRPDFFPENPQDWKHYKPGEHLHYFSPQSLDLYMGRWGMRRVGWGWPEDAIRGKLATRHGRFNNIYTAVYSRAAMPGIASPASRRSSGYEKAANF